MTIEHAIAHSLPKPWGVVDPRPWSSAGRDDNTIGEIWYERSGSAAVAPALLLKLLFTSQPLSIQVHPDDAYAQSIGLPNGKTEAWYVLSAAPRGQGRPGPETASDPAANARRPSMMARSRILSCGRRCAAGDTVFVPAGTIHAIGAGLVIAEIQQRSDATFRLFDHGRGRELHIDNAIAVADAGPADIHVTPSRLTDSRTLLTSNAHFTFEKIDLAPNSAWCLEANRETWLLVVSGSARTGSFDVAMGDAVFAQSDRVNIRAGVLGLSGLVAYTGGLDSRAAAVRRHGNSSMSPLQRVAFIGNHLPRRCGIATFTHDLHRAVSLDRLDLETGVVVMTDAGRTYDYPPAVRFQIHDEVIDEYVQAAEFLNNARFDVVCLQHEYGIFGGEAGRNIIELLSRLEMPVVTTLHTVLAKPTPAQHDVMSQIIDASAKIDRHGRKRP